ncbi:unnamed protein product [Moneuplotes crassus]|uniref:BZIP domain-containing protein n=1 Tax=Euplotes crassus TaxID=5936 RepID=A0AAD1XBF2_EUPCR|nr:unnamed protein product [Moneuplotes crassus]
MDQLRNTAQAKKERKSAVERSREFRRRKKDYLTRLESKVKILEEEVSGLKKENYSLKNTISELKMIPTVGEQSCSSCHTSRPDPKKYSHPLYEYEDFVNNQMKKILIQNPSEIRYATLEQMVSQASDYSDSRRDLLKQKFNDILENMLSFSSKCYLMGFKNVNRAEFLRRNCTKKRREKYIDKEQSESKDIYFDTFLHTNIAKFIEKKGEGFKKSLTSIAVIARKLIRLRNDLFNEYKEQQNFIQGYDDYQKEDIISHYKFIDHVKSKTNLTPHSLFGIKAKTHSKEKYDSGELTE